MENPNRPPRRDLTRHKSKLDAAAETRAVAEAMQCLDAMLEEKENIRKHHLLRKNNLGTVPQQPPKK